MKDKVAFGDEVININGTSLKDCPMSQMAVEEIMNAIPGDNGYIIIKKDNQEKRIEIRGQEDLTLRQLIKQAFPLAFTLENTDNHRITEYPKLEGTHKDH